jgi:dihydropteroate synthase
MKRDFPRIVGIVNVTPDSFSDGGRYFDPDRAIEHALSLIEDGADMLDIGGESTRPGSLSVEASEELRRVVPVIKGVRRVNPFIPISIDTTKAIVAEAALDAGASMVNDISAGRFDSAMLDLVASRGVPIILMHMQGTPRTMQLNPTYTNVVEEVFEFLRERIQIARQRGVSSLVVDVGIGFGKTLEHNLELLRHLDRFATLGVPIMLGISRKRFLGEVTGIEVPAERDVATALVHALLVNAPIEYIRVHNVRLIAQLKSLWYALAKADSHPVAR